MAIYKDRELDELSFYEAQKMCAKKKKLKSSEAAKTAKFFNQRKYQCPICGHWHLTSKRG